MHRTIRKFLLFKRKKPYAKRVQDALGSSIIAYWPLWETSGTIVTDIINGRNGTYVGPLLNQQPGVTNGKPAPFFDGVNDYCNIYSDQLRDALNGGELTWSLWIKVPQSVWTDATGRYAFSLRVNASNEISLFRSTSNGILRAFYTAGGTNKETQITGLSSLEWIHIAFTASKTADQAKAYLNGDQFGTTKNTLGTWAGTISTTQTCIGAVTTGASQPWHGYIAHFVVCNTAHTAATIKKLAVK